MQPRPSLSKLVVASGPWIVHRSDDSCPTYCALIEGSCRLTVAGQAPVLLEAGDFVLVQATDRYTASSLEPPPEAAEMNHEEIRPGVFRLGARDAPLSTQMLVGHCHFSSRDAGLLLSLLPAIVHVRGQRRLTTLVKLVDDELHGDEPGREAVLSRLLEIMLIEALRSTGGPAAPPGLLRGLGDGRIAVALRQMHAHPTRAWTVADLAREAALSRSSFFERFRREVGVAPIEYLLGWRMALAKDMLLRNEAGVSEVAERVGYGSRSAFSVAFTRHVGVSPLHYARDRLLT